MSLEGTLIVLGILVLLSPFLGLPYSFLMWILLVLGLCIACIAFFLRSRRIREASTDTSPHDQTVS